MCREACWATNQWWRGKKFPAFPAHAQPAILHILSGKRPMQGCIGFIYDRFLASRPHVASAYIPTWTPEPNKIWQPLWNGLNLRLQNRYIPDKSSWKYIYQWASFMYNIMRMNVNISQYNISFWYEYDYPVYFKWPVGVLQWIHHAHSTVSMCHYMKV